MFAGLMLAAGAAFVWLAAAVVGVLTATGPVRLLAAAFLVAAALAVMGAAGGVIRRMATPVADLVEAAARVEAGDFGHRVRERGPGEVRSVARAFNRMSAALQEDDRRRREFLADLGHELRTPLAVVRAHAEGIADGVYPADAAHLGPILDATQTLEHLAQDLRTLSLSDAGRLELAREPVDLPLLVNEVLAQFAVTAREAGIELRAEAASDVPIVELDPVRMREVLVNLVANAVRHTPAGGTVTVSAERGPAAGQVSLRIADGGPGIPPELLPRVFERFVRGPGSTGSGLGLAIARELVRAHGGELTAANRPGGGAELSCVLPESL